jgi:hypothetical protein
MRVATSGDSDGGTGAAGGDGSSTPGFPGTSGGAGGDGGVDLDVDRGLAVVRADGDALGLLPGHRRLGLALGLLGRLHRLLELLAQRLVGRVGFLQRLLGLLARLADRVDGRALRVLHGLERVAPGAQHLGAGLAQLLAGGLDVGERFLELGAALGIGGAGEHPAHHPAPHVERVLDEGVVDLALDGARLVDGAAVVAVTQDVVRHDEDGERAEDREREEEQRPPGGPVEDVGDGLHGGMLPGRSQ